VYHDERSKPVLYTIEQTKPIKGLRRVFRFAYFPYCVYEGEKPYRRVVAVADTKRGARRRMNRDANRAEYENVVIERHVR
jgi:hypothetical protein